ncbi:MAG: restriction endonuclease [Anaerolineae bacterium]|nr:restriction endonuclease [Anaerolineae bacterium]
MNSAQPRILSLTEYEPVRLAPPEISLAAGEALLRHYANQVEVEFPTPKTDDQWQLRSLGWVGHIPLTPELHFALRPKMPLANIFRMLEYAYHLDFNILPGLVDCQSLPEFYERLAHLLARRVLDRGRQGFYRAYLPRAEELPYVRGRLDVAQSLRSPGQIKLNCHYQEHTADVADNHILLWTLFCIARSGACTERVLPAIRRAYRALQGPVTLMPQPPQACLNRLYHRLNHDYQPLHALCRFFLEQSGPGHQMGRQKMLPFLVNMARLYELFVAEWLKAHLPDNINLNIQEKVNLSQTNTLQFEIDLVLYDTHTGATRCVLDTKYKTPGIPAHNDIFQVVTYAEAKGCREAILIYPTRLPQPLDETIGDIRIRSLTFALDEDLEQAGQKFRQSLLD